MKQPKLSRRFTIICLLATVYLLSGCSTLLRAAYLEFIPLKGFDSLQTDSRIHYEPDAKPAAEMLESNYNQSIKDIETRLGGKLLTAPQVYLCASDVCFQKYAFNRQAQAEARWRGSLVLLKADSLMADGRLLTVFTHELVHAFWFQRGVGCTPRWWTEGLAVESSDGGGAEKVMQSLATQAIRQGQVFQAGAENGCWTRMPPGLGDMAWPMFYRQSGMFVGWLRASNPKAFFAVLEQLRAGENLAPAIESAYSQSMTSLHRAWQKSLQ